MLLTLSDMLARAEELERRAKDEAERLKGMDDPPTAAVQEKLSQLEKTKLEVLQIARDVIESVPTILEREEQ
jgi:hypothetical protein